MKRFSQLFTEIDRTNRTNEKVAALVRYFADTSHEDAVWALYFLTEKRLSRPVTGRQLMQWASEASGYPAWLLAECYDRVGDFAETVSLLVSEDGPVLNLPLHQLISERILPLGELDELSRRSLIVDTWKELVRVERLLYMKLITGGFRFGTARTLVIRALSEYSGVDKAILSHRLMGSWQPEKEDYQRIISSDTKDDLVSLPSPFCLAYPWEEDRINRFDVENFRIEWKWDGIRCQLLKRKGDVSLWSRGEELISEQFPEVVLAAHALPDNCVLDGEIVAWSEGKVRPFGDLQSRLGRKSVSSALLKTIPVAFVAYDLLVKDGADVRQQTLDVRIGMLSDLVPDQKDGTRIFRVPELASNSWSEVANWREQATKKGTEGVMIKRRGAPYGVGRKKGNWFKWKVEPYTVDAVLVYAQQGHGRRASLYTDYTFAVWNEDELVPVAKAYSGLTDKEIREVDRFIKAHTTGRKGPVRMVTPALVFELAFDGIRSSNRHRSGVAFRFPRISRFRKDKPIEEVDTLDTVKSLLPAGEKKPGKPLNQLKLKLEG